MPARHALKPSCATVRTRAGLWLAAAAALFVSLTCGALAPARAATFPDHTIRIVLPVTPGGGTDIIARLIAERLTLSLGVSVIVDNRPGAGGNIAEEYVAHSKPDGYTLLITTANHATNVSLYRQLGYDPVKDFAPITQLTTQPYLFVVHPSVPVHTVPEFVAYMQAHPGLPYASTGIGMLSQLGMEQFKVRAKFNMTHVPYKGAGPAMVDTVGGRDLAFFPTVVSGLPIVKQGQVRAIAVTGLQRSPLLPDLPTIAESGFPGFQVTGWYGLLAPAGTPAAVIQKLHDATVTVLADPEVRRKIADDGAAPVGDTPQHFDAYIRSEVVRWAKVVKDAHIEAQ